MNLTQQYPFKSMKVGQSFDITSQFQHARVAASEYGRKHNMCFTCRMQAEVPGEPRIMRIWRVELTQASIDSRGRNSMRSIPTTGVDQPNEYQWVNWLNTFTPGQSFQLNTSYRDQYVTLMQWTAKYSSGNGAFISAGIWHDGSLMIHRVI